MSDLEPVAEMERCESTGWHVPRRSPGLMVVAMAMAAMTGCGVSPLSDDWIPRRPLVRDLPAYQAPVDWSNNDEQDGVAATRDALSSSSRNKPAAVKGDLSLRQALEHALLANPDLKATAWDRHTAGARSLQASLPPNPTVDFMVERVGGTGPVNEFKGAETTLQLSQMIETADKRLKRIALAEADRQLALWDYEAKRVALAAETAMRFIDVLAGQERVKLAEQTLSLAEQTLKLVEDRVKSGVAPVLEREKATVRLSTDRIVLERARRQLATARAKLAALWGQDASFASAVGNLDDLAAVPALESVAGKLEQNPQVARWGAEISQRRAAIELAKAKAVPDVTGAVGAMHMNDSDDVVMLFEVMVPLPLFDRNQGGILEARFNLAKANAQQSAAQVSARAMLAQAYNEMAQAHHEASTLRNETLPAARRAFEAVRQAYENGRATYLDVLDAQRTLVDTQREQINAQATYHAAVAATEGLIGEALTGPSAAPPSSPR